MSRKAALAAAVAAAIAAVAAVTVALTRPPAAPAAAAAQSRGPGSATSAPTTSPTPTTSTATRGSRSVVALGDSVTAGTNCDCTPFVQGFARLLAGRDGQPTTATNLGVAGLTTGSLADQLGQPDVAAKVGSADLVVVTIGANDLAPLIDRWSGAGCDASCTAPAVASMARGLTLDLRRIAALGRPGQRVEVTSYWNVFEDGEVADRERGPGFADWSDGVTVAANRQICAVARAAGDTCVDLYTAFLDSDGNRDPTPLLSDDGDHPNAAGHDLIARTLLAATPR